MIQFDLNSCCCNSVVISPVPSASWEMQSRSPACFGAEVDGSKKRNSVNYTKRPLQILEKHFRYLRNTWSHGKMFKCFGSSRYLNSLRFQKSNSSLSV